MTELQLKRVAVRAGQLDRFAHRNASMQSALRALKLIDPSDENE